MKKSKWLLAGLLLLVIGSFGFINLDSVRAQTNTSAQASQLQDLLNRLVFIIQQLQQQLATLKSQQTESKVINPITSTSPNTSSAAATSRQVVFLVTDTSGTRLSGATVTVRSSTASLGSRTTDGGGETQGLPLPVGSSYTAVVSKAGFVSQTINFTVTASLNSLYQFYNVPAIRLVRETVNNNTTSPVTTVTNPTSSSTCGNGVVEGTEQCDGTHFLPGNSCSTYGFVSGSLTCSSSCAVSYGQCSNPATITVISPALNAEWAADQGHTVAWSTSGVGALPITIELLTPSNGSVPGFNAFTTNNDYSEAMSLSSVAPGFYYFRLKTRVDNRDIFGGSGIFRLVAGSTGFNPSAPTAACGNGIVEGAEQCDGTHFLPGNSCSTYGYVNGSLTCNSSCVVGYNQCSNPPVSATMSVSSPTASSVWNGNHTVAWTDSNVPDANTITIELMTPSNSVVNTFTPITVANSPQSKSVNLTGVAPGYYFFRLRTSINGQIINGGSSVFQIAR
ncbi:MAG: hypothetical protein AAB455_03405 [Patescibacteria group bacterium]